LDENAEREGGNNPSEWTGKLSSEKGEEYKENTNHHKKLRVYVGLE
jgi:hypothetical protein